MTEFMGLPIHPLMIHLPVVLVPALILFVVLYLFIPPLRRRIGWVVMLLSFIAPASVIGGWYTGHGFYDQHVEMIAAAGFDTSTFENLLADHLYYGDIAVWVVPALSPLLWLFGALERGRRSALDRADDSAPPAPTGDGEAPPPPPSASDPAAKGRRVVMVILGILILGGAAVAGWATYESGHSGAEAVWSTPEKQ